MNKFISVANCPTIPLNIKKMNNFPDNGKRRFKVNNNYLSYCEFFFNKIKDAAFLIYPDEDKKKLTVLKANNAACQLYQYFLFVVMRFHNIRIHAVYNALF